jgi:hypothetical protein
MKNPPPLKASHISFDAGGNSYAVEHGESGCLRVHKTYVQPYRLALKRAFFEPKDGPVLLYNRYVKRWTETVEEWWEEIQDSKKFAKARGLLTDYQAALKEGDLTLLGLIAEGGQGMRTGNNGRFLAYLGGTKVGSAALKRQAELESLWSRDSRVSSRLRELLDQNNGRFQSVVEQLKQEYDPTRILRLQKGEVYKVIQRKEVATQQDFSEVFEHRKKELLEQWSNTEGIKRFVKDLQVSGNDFFQIFRALWSEVEDKQIPKKLLGVKNGELYFEPNDAPRIATIFNGLNWYSQMVALSEGRSGRTSVDIGRKPPHRLGPRICALFAECSRKSMARLHLLSHARRDLDFTCQSCRS